MIKLAVAKTTNHRRPAFDVDNICAYMHACLYTSIYESPAVQDPFTPVYFLYGYLRSPSAVHFYLQQQGNSKFQMVESPTYVKAARLLIR